MTFTGREGVSNLHACAYYRTSEAYTAVSQTKPEQERGHDYRGHFFVNNELSDYVQEIKIPLQKQFPDIKL